jgi:hypothetical protein
LKYPAFLLLATVWVFGLLCGFTPVAFLFEVLVLGMILVAIRHHQGRRALKLRPAYARRPHALRP